MIGVLGCILRVGDRMAMAIPKSFTGRQLDYLDIGQRMEQFTSYVWQKRYRDGSLCGISHSIDCGAGASPLRNGPALYADGIALRVSGLIANLGTARCGHDGFA